MMRMETYVRLKVRSRNLSPDQISSAIGMPYDKAWKTGDGRDKTIIVEKDNGWIVHSGLPEHDDLEMHMDALLKRLAPFKQRIAAISAEGDVVEFSCVIYSQTAPALWFSKETISAIALMGASLDVDLYRTEVKAQGEQ
jgi:hypothetical protein